MSCKDKNKDCGCGDSALTTGIPCDPVGCSDGEPCAELYCMECVSYCDQTFEFNVNGTPFVIEQGERLMTTIQNLLVLLTDPACVGKTATEVNVISKTNTSLTIGWNPGNDLYKVVWSSSEGNGESAIQASTVTQFTIPDLVSDIEYTIYVTNELETCNSVTIKTKTN